MKSEKSFYRDTEDVFYLDAQTSYSGKLRWFRKPLYDEPTLQQEQVISIIKNHVIIKQEVKWVDVPVE